MKKILASHIPSFFTCIFLFLINLSLKAAPSPANERLVWTFDEDDSNDIKVEDESGNGFKGTLNGTFPNPARVTVDCGKALQFSHANGTYVGSGSAQPTLAYATTVTAWVKPNLHPSNSQLIVRHCTTGLRGWSLSVDTDGRPVFQLRGYSGVDKWGVAKHDTVVTDGDWHFIAGTIEYTSTRSQALSGIGRVSIYVDGVKQPSDGDDDGNDGLSGDDFDILATGLGGKTFSVGRSGFNLDGLTGVVDDIRVFDRALLPPEVLARFWENSIFPLDQGFNASTGLGTKLQSLTYNGDALTVAKASDPTGHTVGFADCDLDSEDLENYAGAEDVFAKTIFDQNGSNNAVQNNQSRQPQVVDGPNGNKVFSVFRTQGMGIPGSYNDISGVDELTIFFAAKWDGSPSSAAIHMLTAGRHVPAAGQYPLSMYLFKTNFENSTGKPFAEVKVLQNGQTVRKNLGATGTFGRRNVFEIYELVFDSNDKVALFNSGRLVSEAPLNGYSIIDSPPFGDGLFWGGHGNYSSGFTGDITPPLIFKTALSDSERDIVRESIAGAYGIPLPDNSTPSVDEFTIVVLPDTQQYAEDSSDPENPATSAEPQEIQDVMDWISSNKSSWNIQLVLQSGDIVNHGPNINEWNIVDGWYDTLDSTGIPYAVVPGNHDYIKPINNRDSVNYNTYFPTTRFDCSSWSNCGNIEFFETGKTDNLFYTLTIQDEDYIVLTLEFQPRDSVVTWADSVLTTHSDKKAIILTHDFMDEGGNFGSSTFPGLIDANSPRDLYDDLMSQHSNIFLVINGHHARGASRRFDSGTGAHYLFFDPMLKDWGDLGLMRLLVVSPSNKTIRVMTHSPDSNIYRNDYQNLFTLDLP